MLRSTTGTALDAERLVTGGSTCAGRGGDGAVNLIDVELYLLNCNGARLRNPSGPALQADRVRVERNAFLRNGFTATGAGPDGVVRLRGAQVGGLSCTGAVLDNESGPGLVADGLRVAGNVLLRNGFRAVVSGTDGAVGLIGAHLGSLDLSNAELRNTAGVALEVDGMRVDREVFLDRVVAEWVGPAGAVRLIDAHLGSAWTSSATARTWRST